MMKADFPPNSWGRFYAPRKQMQKVLLYHAGKKHTTSIIQFAKLDHFLSAKLLKNGKMKGQDQTVRVLILLGMRRVPSKLGAVWMQMPGRLKLQILENSNCKWISRCHRIQRKPNQNHKVQPQMTQVWSWDASWCSQTSFRKKKMCLKHLLTSRSASSKRDLRSFLNKKSSTPTGSP